LDQVAHHLNLSFWMAVAERATGAQFNLTMWCESVSRSDFNERAQWAVSDNNEIVCSQIAAQCTFRREGREPDIRCKFKPRMLHQSDPTFKLAPIRARLCSAEGSTERILPGFTFVANGCCRNVARNGHQPLGFGTGFMAA
jgi:hypothetical protein